ncbi:MAG: ribonuclease III [Porticoccaceae bacterium]|jgi:ribonuclease-3
MIANIGLEQLQQRIGYQFRDTELLKLALSHRSCGAKNNERLEFLGDSILSLVVSDFLYQKFADAQEGDLSRMRSQIVRAESLAEVARGLELGSELLLGQGEMKSGGHRRDSILGDAVEALIGAIYLDANLDESRRCVLNWFKDLLNIADEAKPAKDAKTSLQEFLQQRGHGLPQYRVIETGGEAHSRLFTVSCKIDMLDREFTATASSRRKAEQMVAEKFLATLEIDF